MSHCVACNALLTDKEAKRKHKITKEELGLCNICLHAVEEIQHIPVKEDYPEPYSDIPSMDEDYFNGDDPLELSFKDDEDK